MTGKVLYLKLLRLVLLLKSEYEAELLENVVVENVRFPDLRFVCYSKR